MTIEKLKLDFFEYCGYRIECEFEEEPTLSNNATVLYSQLFPAPANSETISTSRENFRIVLKANGIQAVPTKLVIIGPNDDEPRHNTKVATVRNEYRRMNSIKTVKQLNQIRDILSSFEHHILHKTADTKEAVRTKLEALLADF